MKTDKVKNGRNQPHMGAEHSNVDASDNIWVTDFIKGTQSTIRATWSKYTLSKAPHPYTQLPWMCKNVNRATS